MSAIRLLVVDDHRIIINGIRSMLEGIEEIQIIGEAINGREAVEFVKKNAENVDVILMDIKMPEINGIEATKQILENFPHIKVLALSMFDDNLYITSMLQAGAQGYILKNTDKQELITAIQRVGEGETYFSRKVTSVVMQTFISKNMGIPQAGFEVKPEELTAREIEILKLIAQQLTNQEIAEKLLISPRTVHSHRRSLMQKIGVKNTAGLVRYAVQNKLLDEESISSD
ncbi:MAG: response regulator transcription factor [Bacteroidia bacterium]|nr:response regulator transcription factor [Bacteroidia bacterium]MDW8157337.1 response regulator transcription factor [Bacteroidia bacterium]